MFPHKDLNIIRQRKEDKKVAWQRLLENISHVHEQNSGFSAEEVEADVDETIRDLRRD